MDEVSTAAPEKSLSVEKVGLDALTGVWNRAGFIAAATPMFVVCQRRVAPVTLGYFDIRSTHENRSTADKVMLNEVLKAVANQMGKTFRDCDIVGRIDPLRFAVLFADCTDEALGAIEGVRAVTDESTPPNSNVLTIAMVEGAPEATLGGLMHEADLRIDELRLRDTPAPQYDEPVWTRLPAKAVKPAKRRARSRR
jgi:GGDEF domain-containing protein